MRNLKLCSLAAGVLLLSGTGAFALTEPMTAQDAAMVAHTQQVRASQFGWMPPRPVTEPMTAQDAAMVAHADQVRASQFGWVPSRPVTEPMTAQDAAWVAHRQQATGIE